MPIVNAFRTAVVLRNDNKNVGRSGQDIFDSMGSHDLVHLRFSDPASFGFNLNERR